MTPDDRIPDDSADDDGMPTAWALRSRVEELTAELADLRFRLDNRARFVDRRLDALAADVDRLMGARKADGGRGDG